MITSWHADIKKNYKAHLRLFILLFSETSGITHKIHSPFTESILVSIKLTHSRDSTRKDTWNPQSLLRFYLVKHQAPLESYTKEYNVFHCMIPDD